MPDMEFTAAGLTDFQQKAILVFVGAIIGFIGNFLNDQLKARRSPGKRLTWNARTQVGIVSIDPKFQRHIKIAYNEKPIDDICSVDFRVKNTGNEVVKNQRMRLVFPEESRVLEVSLSPEPDRELGVTRNVAQEETDREVVYEIGHLEVGEEVSLRIVATGQTAKNWRVRSHNDEGNVRFEEGEAQRITDDTQRIVPFIVLTFTLWALPNIFSYFGQFGSYAVTLVQLALFIAIIPQLTPVARVLKDLAVRVQSGKTGTKINITGRDNSVIHQSGSGFVELGSPKPGEPQTDPELDGS